MLVYKKVQDFNHKKYVKKLPYRLYYGSLFLNIFFLPVTTLAAIIEQRRPADRRKLAIVSFFDTKHSAIFVGESIIHLHILDSSTKLIAFHYKFTHI